MESNRNANAIVVGQRKNQQKPESASLEGGQEKSGTVVLGRIVHVSQNLSRSKKGKNGGRGKGDDNIHPRLVRAHAAFPVVSPQTIHTRKVMWEVQSAFSQTAFTLSDGASQFMVSSNTTGSLVCFVDAWKLRSLRFFLKDSDGDESVGMVFTPSSSTTDNFLDELPRSFQMNSGGTNGYAEYLVDLQANHPAGSWHRGTSVNQSGTLFALATTGNITNKCVFVEATLDYIMNLVGAPPGFSLTGTGTTTAGEFYTHSIMGSAMTVISQNTIT